MIQKLIDLLTGATDSLIGFNEKTKEYMNSKCKKVFYWGCGIGFLVGLGLGKLIF
ncbi:hypothetical protein LJC10_00410 [Selenomonadales bacterium OttesenSCG-928-I06]|nr:hypothetical protein [Selenomonadales bacterium OttesenSCG-928-I06]